MTTTIRTSLSIAALTVLIVLALVLIHTIALVDWLNRFADSSISPQQTQQKLLSAAPIKGSLMPAKAAQPVAANYTSRQLKTMAQQAKVKGYSNMTKAQLLHALVLV